MTLPSTYTPAYHAGNDVTTTFPFGFRVLEASNLEVITVDPDGVEAEISTFTATGVGSSTGGSVILPAPLPTGWHISIKRRTGRDQGTEFRGQGAFFEEIHEDVADKAMMILQEQQEQIDRAFTAPNTGGPYDLEIPHPVPGYALGWDATGTRLENVPNTGANQSADLANTASGSKGAGLLGFNAALSYLAGSVGAFLVGLAGASGAAQLGYTQAGVGATLRTIQDALRDRVCVFGFMTAAEIADVKAYTYTLDVSAAVQKAIDAAAGKEILFPAGGYKIGTKVNYFNTTGVAQPRGLKILGEGEGNTIFKNEVANNPLFDINTGVGATAGAYFFSYGGYISGVTILGHSSFANSDGIKIRSCWKFRLENVLIDSCTRYGLHVDNDTGINPDYTASANMQMKNVRIVACKKGIYQPYGNGWPIARLTNVYIISCTDLGVECNSTSFQWIQGACAYNGTAYAGDGTPDPAYGGILIGSADNYVSKGVVLDGIELDDNHPQQVWMYNAKSPIIRNCSVASRITGGYLNKYSFVFGRDSAATYCDDFWMVNNNLQLPNTLAATGLTHHFVYTKAWSRGGMVGINGYSIAGGTMGTEVFFIKEDAKAGSASVAKYRTKFLAQNGDQTRAAYAVQYDGAMPISRLSMGDDTAISLKPLADSGAILVSFNGAISNSAIILFSVSGGKTALMSSGSTGINISAVSLVLTGTDGTDAKTTVSVDAATGKIYVENRLGGTVYLTAQILDGFGDWL